MVMVVSKVYELCLDIFFYLKQLINNFIKYIYYLNQAKYIVIPYQGRIQKKFGIVF